jgi:FkbM family methyltransferase
LRGEFGLNENQSVLGGCNLSHETWLERKFGSASYRLYCDLENDKRARKIASSMPGYIYPLSHFLWANLVISMNWNRIIDVGANYGEFSLDALIYSKDQDTQIVCFEPSKSTFEYIALTMRPFNARVELNNFGISSENKVLVFRESTKSSGGSRILDANAPSSSSVRHYPVKFLTLNPWLENSGNILIKLDVEGHEPDILQGIDWTKAKDVCFFLEINQIDLTLLQSKYLNLDLYVFSRYRGRLIRTPKIRRLPKFMLRYRDLYMQDAILIHSDFTVGVDALERITISAKQRLRWLSSSEIDVFSYLKGVRR